MDEHTFHVSKRSIQVQFIWSRYYLHDLYTTEDTIQLLCRRRIFAVSKPQQWAKLLIYDSWVSNCIDCLEQRSNMAFVFLFYRYYNGLMTNVSQQHQRGRKRPLQATWYRAKFWTRQSLILRSLQFRHEVMFCGRLDYIAMARYLVKSCSCLRTI